MKKVKKKSAIGGWRRDNDAKVDWVRTIMAFPLIEVVIALVFGLIFYFILKNQTLAELTWILGPALSISRNAFENHMEDKFDMLSKLTNYVDFRSNVKKEFEEMVDLYTQITEADFSEIKEDIIKESKNKLSKLAHDKRSDELNTGEYFKWLFKFLSDTKRGARIWAISMNLEIEWNKSQEEDTFLELNLEAAKRKVTVERIFVIKEKSVQELMNNIYIKSQLDATGEYFIPLFVTKEHLEEVDKKLLDSLGQGIIAVDRQVVLIDIASEDGFRGVVTMNPIEIDTWVKRYEQLRVYASDINGICSKNSENVMDMSEKQLSVIAQDKNIGVPVR